MPTRNRKRKSKEPICVSSEFEGVSKNQELKTDMKKIPEKHRGAKISYPLIGMNSLIIVLMVFLGWIFSSDDFRNIEIIDDDHQNSSPSKYLIQRIKSTEDFLTLFVCQNSKGYCHPHLKSIGERRTHNTKAFIPPRDTILVLPRSQCITDLDALRDNDFVRKELLGTKHLNTEEALDSGAYLAAYLVWRFQQIELSEHEIISNEDQNYHHMQDINEANNEFDPMLPFFQILPNRKNLLKIQNHPVLWSQKKSEHLLGKHTVASRTVAAFRDMIQSEFKAFASRSSAFAKNIHKMDYIIMRINVMSRSFGTGPPGREEADPSFVESIVSGDEITSISKPTSDNIKEEWLKKELEYYENTSGLHLEKGCRAMAPILDMWDHHAKPNVEWKYDNNRQSFIVTAKEPDGIPKGSDVMVSYGKYTDTHLFAKFGFVNGDGSGWIEASIAVFHSISDAGLGHQFSYPVLKLRELLPSFSNYLAFDDGFPTCIESPSTKSNSNERHKPLGTDESDWKFKRLKLLHLYKLSNYRQYWVFKLPPRNPDSQPSQSSDLPIMTDSVPLFNSQSVELDTGARTSKLLMTCRLIVLNPDDFDGKAYFILHDALHNDAKEGPLLIPRQSDFLEYRALNCLKRLSLIALSQYPNSISHNLSVIKGETDISSNKNGEAFSFQSPEWYAAHVKLGEMQSLEVLRGYASSGVEELKRKILKENGDSYKNDDEQRNRQRVEQKLVLRKNPCQPNPLLYEDL